MKKLFAVLFCTLAMAGLAFADELSYEIDPVATAKAPWKVGDKIVKEGKCEGTDFYREFLGVTQSGLALVQDFYLSGRKFTSPFLTTVRGAAKTAGNACPYIEGLYIQWYENGQKKTEAYLKNDKLNGLMTTWYENGQKKGEIDYKNNKAIGKVRLWSKTGNRLPDADASIIND